MINGPAGRAVRHVAVQLAVHLAAAPGQVVGAARLLATVDQHVVRSVASGVGPDVKIAINGRNMVKRDTMLMLVLSHF